MTYQPENETVDDVSAAFDLLRDARRRGVLYALKRNGRTSVEELARRIAAWQSEDRDEVNPETVELSLIHSHLPKLREADAVEYDLESATVELAGRGDELDPLLECTREREPELFYAARTPNVRRPEVSQ
ncbi:DUF7344 domain-containing protein [Halorussus caseinilyticus]|uniref:DUF7344 domain-containing protein n=1 Tax=Halorussus caseinilyticus TaxID=3034025 RepID=A0ABD5WP88_9EURY|nr:hypothetical protein [Halorussus sp. DT72]